MKKCVSKSPLFVFAVVLLMSSWSLHSNYPTSYNRRQLQERCVAKSRAKRLHILHEPGIVRKLRSKRQLMRYIFSTTSLVVIAPGSSIMELPALVMPLASTPLNPHLT